MVRSGHRPPILQTEARMLFAYETGTDAAFILATLLVFPCDAMVGREKLARPVAVVRVVVVVCPVIGGLVCVSIFLCLTGRWSSSCSD
ncbi:hypothetical protein BCR43DRAFT_487790 [Syncephalastrum racemosum]|uniref:Uncharacterized protein n=1 Tax=Syncephalastrum racemosum TaxID=13706 RepID=A0A1X2HHN4_SYNRA|nr:hypothetical protein BCR43DRAFT_487790 [Syncephalastrum racemosum]